MITISDQSAELSPGFGVWLKEQIQVRGLNQTVLSSRSHVPRKIIRDIISGQSTYTRYYNLRALARGLGISNGDIYAAAGCADPDQPAMQEQLKESKSLYHILADLIGPEDE